MDSDTDKGTGTAKIGGQTVTQKNLSYYTKCTGNEAGCAPMKNVISHVNTGKEYAHAWSGNVKMDGEPISRFSDIATNDHASPQAGGPPFPRLATGNGVIYSTPNCMIGTYDAIAAACNEAGGEAHHIVPDKAYRISSRANAEDAAKRVPGAPSLADGVCICLTPENHDKVHEAEREAMDAVGKGGVEQLSKKKAEAKKAAMKKRGEWGIGSRDKVHEAAKRSLDDLDLPANCIKKAKEAVDSQKKSIKRGQKLRTSNSLPNKSAVKVIKKTW